MKERNMNKDQYVLKVEKIVCGPEKDGSILQTIDERVMLCTQ